AALDGIENVSRRTPPDCIVWSFEESYLKYAVRYHLADFQPDDPTDSEVRKRIWYTLRRENIEIPYPGHNLFVTELTPEREAGKTEREHTGRMKALSSITIFAPLAADEREL